MARSKLSSNMIQEQTQAIIDSYRNLPGEFYMLKGLLCLSSVVERHLERTARSRDVCETDCYHMGSVERKKVESIFDGVMIAARMDELNREALGG